MKSRWLIFILVSLGVSACGTTRPISTRGANPLAAEVDPQPVSQRDPQPLSQRDSEPASAAPLPYAEHQSFDDRARARSEGQDADTAPRAAGRSAARDTENKSAENRPGLATHWGETRFSGVRSAPFERQDPYRPFTITQVYYNDAEGVSALTERLGARRVDNFNDPSGLLSVAVLDENDEPLRGFDTGARSLVVGEAGERYTIRIRNDSGVRLEAVATVDGLDVIDGRPGAFSKRGYLIEPWSSLNIEGFRRSENAVAAFRFGSVAGSYAASKGAARNVGVIAVAFFREQGASSPWLEEEAQRRRSADPFPGRFAEPPSRW